MILYMRINTLKDIRHFNDKLGSLIATILKERSI